MLTLGVDPPKTHKVRELLKLILAIKKNEKLEEVFKKRIVELGAIEDLYISARYADREYTRE